MPVNLRHVKRQELPEVPSIPTLSNLRGVETLPPATTQTSFLILSSTEGAASTPSAPPLAGTPTITISSTISPTNLPSSLSPPSPDQSAGSAAVKSSTISLSTVVAACVGAFVGLALVICLFIWWTRRTTPKARNIPRSPMAENRNTRGEMERDRTHSGLWNKLDDESEGMPPITRQMTQQEIDEKNFSMFKRSQSTRTTKTTKALEEHGIDLPPIELSKYHPQLAEQFALQSPEKPFASRQESGVSWDGETVGDDSFLSLRSVRVDSGAMSPTLSMAKVTPPTQSQLHRWESAEVISMDEPAASITADHSKLMNPFSDQTIERRKSHNNPFFGASETPIPSRRGSRSRSNSRSRRSQSRERRPRSHSNAARDTVISRISEVINPFDDIANTVEVAPPPPAEREFSRHSHNDSIASGASGDAFSSSYRAMESLIAALDLSHAEVQERLRVSMQPSVYSQANTSLYARDEPVTPTTPHAQ